MTLNGKRLGVGLSVIVTVVVLGLVVVFGGAAIAHFDCINSTCSNAERLKATSDARTLLTQIVAGAGGAGALYFTWVNYIRTVRDSNVTQLLARESRTSENFSKAVEQLGH